MSDSVPFIEIDFTARDEEGEVFDTTKLDVAKQEGLQGRGRFKPMRAPLKEGYLLKGLYDFLKDKKKGSYTVELEPEQAFGKKDGKLIKLISAGKFRDADMTPRPGLEVEVDNRRGVVRSVSGGRVLVDFNHPMAGKTVVYEIEHHGFVEDPGECFKALMQLVLNVPPSMLTTEMDGTTLKVMIEVHQKVPDAMFAEIGRIGAEMIEGVEKVEIEQVEHDHSKHDHAPEDAGSEDESKD